MRSAHEIVVASGGTSWAKRMPIPAAAELFRNKIADEGETCRERSFGKATELITKLLLDTLQLRVVRAKLDNLRQEKRPRNESACTGRSSSGGIVRSCSIVASSRSRPPSKNPSVSRSCWSRKSSSLYFRAEKTPTSGARAETPACTAIADRSGLHHWHCNQSESDTTGKGGTCLASAPLRGCHRRC